VRDGRVVKGVKFRNHEDVGGIIELAMRYREAGADELVFYDITASVDDRSVSPDWVKAVSREDKISINSPALMNPDLITELTNAFGQQCIVIGIDSFEETSNARQGVLRWIGSKRSVNAALEKSF